MNTTITWYRVTESDNDGFSEYGDVIAIEEKNDTNLVHNITTNSTYTQSNEKGTKIENIREFPLLDSERFNKQSMGL